MIKKIFWLLFFPGVLLIVLSSLSDTQAQTLNPRLWHGPRLLSSPGVENAGEPVVVADEYGNLHIFWSEQGAGGITTLQYARFDGEIWTEPIDILAKPPSAAIVFYSVAVDHNGRLHLVWTEGNEGPLFYSNAPANDALSSRAWSPPLALNAPAYQVQLKVDSQNNLHLMYINFYGIEPGIYYMRSTDGGENWSSPFWIDPDIPTSYTPSVLNFVIDQQDGLHASWYYEANIFEEGRGGEAVVYAHSLDGGNIWAKPINIDVADDDPDELRLPHPNIIVLGDVVHIIWAGTVETNRKWAYSLDRGITWSESVRIFGSLQGVALGDSLIIDAAGRLHFFGQIRWPQGVQHAVWDTVNGWSDPEMIYLIARNSQEGRQGRYHAHSIRAAVRNGNQIVVAFTDEANGPLYVMYSTLEDVPPLPLKPTPSPTPAPLTNTPTPVGPTATPQKPLFDSTVNSGPPPNIANGFWIGIVPAIVLVTAFVMIRMHWRSKRTF